MSSQETFPCPACGEDVPAKAKACPHCGACGKSGWNEESSVYDGTSLAEDDFDYRKFVEKEFGDSAKLDRKLKFGKITAGVLFVLVVILILCNKFFYP